MKLFQDTVYNLTGSTRQKTAEGYLIVTARIARTGTQEYFGYELPQNGGMKIDPEKVYKIYRSAAEVFNDKTLQSFEHKPVTNEHPFDVGGTLDATTATQKLVGVTGENAKKVGDELEIKLTLFDAKTIEDVESGKIGLSAGYEAELKMVPGVTDEGEEFDGSLSKILGNHVAVCYLQDARGGEKCRILDTNQQENMKEQVENKMASEDAVPDLTDINQIGQMIQKMAGSLQEGLKNILEAIRGSDSVDEAETEGDSEMPVPLTDEDSENMDSDKNGVKKMTATDSLKKLKKEVAFLKGQLQVSKKNHLTDSRISKIVSERVKLIKDAEKILPGEDLTFLDSVEIKKRVIKAAMPEIVLDSNPAFIDGAYQSCVSSFLRGANSAFDLAGAINDSYLAGGEAANDIYSDLDNGTFADQAYQKLQERRKQIFEKGIK